ncbi:MAG: YHYH protein, partial [Bacteroidota bacterium]
PTGPFSDGNPSQAEDQDAIFQIPLFPEENTGTPIETNPGNIGIFINGVALFDYRDGVAWNPETNDICGGPGNPPCPGGMGAEMDWNRDAIPAEMAGFDCSKAHPAMGNYHHHQNPSAFDLDINVVSEICNLYDADGLYAIDPEQHSPLIGFAYDGFPIYGAYGYQNTDGTGGIVRIKSSYELNTATTRADGPDVADPYFNGYFREDYVYVENAAPDYLDEHNGRFCVTPEYPEGIYCYFATVDENWNSAYPYVVGPTFYGEAENRSVNSVNENTTVYDGTSNVNESPLADLALTIFPNPTSDLLAVQINDLVQNVLTLNLMDQNGKLVMTKEIKPGTTIAYFDTQTLYSGQYLLQITSAFGDLRTEKVMILK